MVPTFGLQLLSNSLLHLMNKYNLSLLLSIASTNLQVPFEPFSVSTIWAALISFSQPSFWLCAAISLSLSADSPAFSILTSISFHLCLSHLFWLPARIALSHFPSSVFPSVVSWAIASYTVLDPSQLWKHLSHAFCMATTFSILVYNLVSVSYHICYNSFFHKPICKGFSLCLPSHHLHKNAPALNIPFSTHSFHFLQLLWLYASGASQLSAV